jgi:hypothetical protein
VRLFKPRAAAAAALAVVLAFFEPAGADAQTGTAPAGPVVRLAYRSLQPGEPSRFLDSTGRSRRGDLLGPTADSGRPGVRTTWAKRPPLGIDVQTKPGLRLTVKVLKKARCRDVRKLLVVDRKFPSTKLTLDPTITRPLLQADQGRPSLSPWP